MKIKANIKQFSQAINKLQPIAGGRSTLPVLASVLVDCRESDDSVSLSVTNLDQRATITIPATISSPGVMLVSASLLGGIVRQLDGDDVSIDVDSKNKALIQGVNRKATLYGLAPVEFPPPPKEYEAHTLKVDCAELSKRIRSLLPLVSRNQGRYVLESVSMISVKGKMWMFSTNGRALGVWKSEIEYSGPDIIIPDASASMLPGILEGGEGEISFSERAFSISNGDTVFRTLLVEGATPNFLQVIPDKDNRNKSIPVDRFALEDAIKFASQGAAKPGDIGVRLDVSPTEISASYHDEARGEVTARIDTAGKADAVKFALNPKYALAALSLFNDETVSLEFIDETSPFVIENDDAIAVLMPMRIN